ncbi:MAG: hypothetical protein WBL28_10690 [Methylotenera sp.]
MAANEIKFKTAAEIMDEYRPKANNGLKVDEADAIKPTLPNEADQAWLREYQANFAKIDALVNLLDKIPLKKQDTSEVNQIKHDLLETEFQLREYIEDGYKNHRVKSEMHIESGVDHRDFVIDGMVYSNGGTPPRPDIADPAIARKTWVLEKFQAIRDYFQGAKQGANNLMEGAKPYAKVIAHDVGAMAIDSAGPTPSKLLSLPKIHLPHMDYLRDGIIDESASQAGIKTPGEAAMDKLIPIDTRKAEPKPFGFNGAVDEKLLPTTQRDEKVAAFLNGDPEAVAKAFPSLNNAYALQAMAEQHLQTTPYLAQEQGIIMAQVNQRITEGIHNNSLPQAYIDTHQPMVNVQLASHMDKGREIG